MRSGGGRHENTGQIPRAPLIYRANTAQIPRKYRANPKIPGKPQMHIEIA